MKGDRYFHLLYSLRLPPSVFSGSPITDPSTKPILGDKSDLYAPIERAAEGQKSPISVFSRDFE